MAQCYQNCIEVYMRIIKLPNQKMKPLDLNHKNENQLEIMATTDFVIQNISTNLTCVKLRNIKILIVKSWKNKCKGMKRANTKPNL